MTAWISGGLALGGAAISAGSSIYAGQQASKGSGGKNLPAAGFDPYNDPLLNASQILTLQALGMPIDAVLNAASPLQQLQNSLSAPNAGTADRKRLQQTTQGVAFLSNAISSIENGSKTVDQAISDLTQFGYYPSLTQAAGLAGNQSIKDLINSELNYRTQTKTLKAQAAALAPTVQAGRTGASTEYANLQANTIPGLDQLINAYQLPQVREQDILAASEAERSRMREKILQSANVGGFNPAAGLAEAERDPNPLANAIQLLNAKQGLGINELTALLNKSKNASMSLDSLYKSIFDPIGVSNQTASIGIGGATQNASIAANQASTAASLAANAANAKGTAVAGAGNTLGNAIGAYPLFADYLKNSALRNQTQPAANPAASSNRFGEFEYLLNYLSGKP